MLKPFKNHDIRSLKAVPITPHTKNVSILPYFELLKTFTRG